MTVEKKLIFTILLCLLFVLVLVFIIVKPSFIEIQDLSSQVQKEQQALEELYQKGKTVSQIKNELRSIEEKEKMLNKIFFSKNEELTFIKTLEQISSQNNIKQEIAIKGQQDFQSNFLVININLNLEGSFKNLIKYFQSLESMDTYFNVVSLNVAPLSSNNELIVIDLTAKTYWQK